MVEIRQRWIWGIAALCLLGGVLGVVFFGKEDPRELALGEWKESTGRIHVEVMPGTAVWRGMGHGKLTYEWVQADKEPYRLLLHYHHDTYEATLRFDGRNTAILEPNVWEKMPTTAQKELSRFNRSHSRPEREIRLVFRRLQVSAP